MRLIKLRSSLMARQSAARSFLSIHSLLTALCCGRCLPRDKAANGFVLVVVVLSRAAAAGRRQRVRTYVETPVTNLSRWTKNSRALLQRLDKSRCTEMTEGSCVMFHCSSCYFYHFPSALLTSLSANAFTRPPTRGLNTCGRCRLSLQLAWCTSLIIKYCASFRRVILSPERLIQDDRARFRSLSHSASEWRWVIEFAAN